MGGEIRIVGGQWKRTRLAVLDKPGLRPTPDRVRETLFNWLGQSLEAWSCVDVFAGTGALGLEAASRGAAPVQLLEQELDVWVVTDACGSRTERNRDAAFDRLAGAGAELVTTEMVAFEWLRSAEHPAFREVQALIK